MLRKWVFYIITIVTVGAIRKLFLNYYSDFQVQFEPIVLSRDTKQLIGTNDDVICKVTQLHTGEKIIILSHFLFSFKICRTEIKNIQKVDGWKVPKNVYLGQSRSLTKILNIKLYDFVSFVIQIYTFSFSQKKNNVPPHWLSRFIYLAINLSQVMCGTGNARNLCTESSPWNKCSQNSNPNRNGSCPLTRIPSSNLGTQNVSSVHSK